MNNITYDIYIKQKNELEKQKNEYWELYKKTDGKLDKLRQDYTVKGCDHPLRMKYSNILCDVCWNIIK